MATITPEITPQETTKKTISLKEFLDSFFDGSEEKLAEFLRRGGAVAPIGEIEHEAGLDAALL